ncbi:MAG: superoxide dismutase [Bacteroidia bacterium]|nr:superoxide dismutase [Bacteroidia bacterium]
MKFGFPELPYEINALEPFISGKTLKYHHEKYHQVYVENLNRLIMGTKFENKDLETIIKVAEGAIFNNAALAWNHSFYFSELKTGNNQILKGTFARVIKRNFGSVRFFKEMFTGSAVSLLGSGWIWLILNQKGSMEIIHESNAGNPLRRGLIPLLTCDVWEHAYYLDYKNRRSDYLEAFWKLINWELIEKRYDDAGKESKGS